MELPKVNKSYQLSDNEGDGRQAQRLYIIAHDTGNDINNGTNSAENEAAFMKRNYGNAYVHYIAGWDQIYLIGTPGYVAWGALGGNPYSPMQIELSHYADHSKAIQAYQNWVNTLHFYADQYGIPKTLDAGSVGTPGIKSHLWISEHIGGTHVDPYGYLSQIGIRKAQFANDLLNGFGGSSQAPQPAVDNRLIAKVVCDSAVNLLNKSGKYIGHYLQPNTRWLVTGSKTINGESMLQVATDMFLPLKYTDLTTITINYTKGYGINALNSEGKQVIGSNRIFKDGTSWKVVNIRQIGDQWCFLVGNDLWIPKQYVK